MGSSTASTSSEEASANNTVEGLIGASKEQAKTTKEGAELEKAAKRLLKQAQKELSDAPALPTKED